MCCYSCAGSSDCAEILHQLDRFCRCDGGDGVFVDQVLPPFVFDDDGEGVKPLDTAPELKAVGQVNGHHGLVLAQLIEKHILQILCLLHFVANSLSGERLFEILP